MVRKPAWRWMRIGIATVPWVLSGWLAEGALGGDIGRTNRDIELRIEMQLKGGIGTPPPASQPERSHEDSIEPWELVGV